MPWDEVRGGMALGLAYGDWEGMAFLSGSGYVFAWLVMTARAAMVVPNGNKVNTIDYARQADMAAQGVYARAYASLEVGKSGGSNPEGVGGHHARLKKHRVALTAPNRISPVGFS